MSDDTGRTFLSRWSRRKIEARAAERSAPADAKEARSATPAPVAATPISGAAATGEVAAAPADPAAQHKAAEELPDPETLRGLESDYRGFLRPEVDESLRRTALKKLFADPHFNVMDGLDVYIDDYSKPDPIPPELLRQLNQARGLRLFEDEENEAASSSAGTAESADAAAQQGEPIASDASAAAPEETGLLASTDCPVESDPSPAGDEVPPIDGNKG